MAQQECPQAAFHGNPFRYCPCGWVEEERPAPTFEEDLRHVLNKHGIDAKTNTADTDLVPLVVTFLSRVQRGVVLPPHVDGAIDSPDVLYDLEREAVYKQADEQCRRPRESSEGF
jgi:hypothetical protein